MITGLFLSSPSCLPNIWRGKIGNMTLNYTNFRFFFFFYLNKNAKECWPNKGEVEANRQLEIQLNGGTLMVPANGILDLNVNLYGRKERWHAWCLGVPTVSPLYHTTHLRPIKRSIAWVENPFLPKVVQAVLQLLWKQTQIQTHSNNQAAHSRPNISFNRLKKQSWETKVLFKSQHLG